MKTPYEKFRSLSSPERYLRPGNTLVQLEQTALSKSDNDAAEQMNKARDLLFQSWTRRFEKQA
jgi:hypothetical protein